MVSEIGFFKKKMKSKSEKIMFTCISDLVLFSSFFYMLTFSHVLHLDIILKLRVKTEVSLCMGIMQNNPLPSLCIRSNTIKPALSL